MTWLNYHHLYYFWVTAREGGISSASLKLRVGEPTISTQIKNLEESLNRRLFNRRNRGLHLTEAGMVVLDYANQIFNLGNELMKVIKDKTFSKRTHFKLGASIACLKVSFNHCPLCAKNSTLHNCRS
jgi:LysR family transcriptional regulator, transcriptional activator of nhaA